MTDVLICSAVRVGTFDCRAGSFSNLTRVLLIKGKGKKRCEFLPTLEEQVKMEDFRDRALASSP
jgi:hypothetical protein